ASGGDEGPRLATRHLRLAVLGELDLDEALALLGELDLLRIRQLTGPLGVEGAGGELDLHLYLLALPRLLGELALRLDPNRDAALEDALLAVAEDLQRRLLAALGGGRRISGRRRGEHRADREGQQ